ncbi:MAG: PHP domain-containing protein [Melioribacteraceae bacterium]|nr:PHP domain-containing protein [Melioribacteraceae bacterium]MCF8266153.1 PHP domain-containing protein [Melioribacteraceae bacterium]MCF8412030.1 PHP domain-containing protein [Melioribacteraceae bacterium]MCF8432804.1 PHP domain-containing protein [Melioribacteraceae bacterium]
MHMHTVYSDGFLTPKELVEKAHSRGLTCISITDHDTVDAIDEVKSYADKYGIDVIPGVEISTNVDGVEIHILGYFINHYDSELLKYLKFFREERYFRAKRIIDKLIKLGFDISITDVENEAQNSAIGRPHIASALLKLGYTKNFYEAFNKLIGDFGPAYEQKIHVSAKSAFKILNDAGGLTFIAHPGNLKESILKKLIEWGIDGIEVTHPSHDRYKVKFYRGITQQYCLLESGGSDFHGGAKDDYHNIGKYFISTSKVEAMRKMISKNTA